MQEYVLKVSAQEANMRLDLFIIDFSKKNDLGLSRTFVQKLISDGKVMVNKANLIKAHFKVKAGDGINIRIEDKEPSALKAEEIPLDIIYEDLDLAIVNKSSGLVVHPAPGNYEHTLVNALLHRFKNLSDISPERPGIVHRLDKETSGLLVVAKNNTAHLVLSKQFAKHSIKRKYIAIVKGRTQFNEDIIAKIF